MTRALQSTTFQNPGGGYRDPTVSTEILVSNIECFIDCLGVGSVSLGETIHHHDNVDEFQLAFVEDGNESQGNF